MYYKKNILFYVMPEDSELDPYSNEDKDKLYVGIEV